MPAKLYEEVYNYYLDLMKKGDLKEGDKMPSLRTSEREMGVSRTTVENAYFQLSADGYIYGLEKSGYYVTGLFAEEEGLYTDSQKESVEGETDLTRDFFVIGQEKKVSCLNLWKRYVKNALRQEERLLSYASNQGEEDLREEIRGFVRKQRNIICSKEDIVIGAGFQNLFHILIPLINIKRGDQKKTISLPNQTFKVAERTFVDAGFKVSFRNKEAASIYVAPQYMTNYGEVMPMKRRRELIAHGRQNGHLIIEDDYQSDFVFSKKPCPSLYAMAKGENVAYLGSFSMVLLPSVRISFLILPRGYRETYESIKDCYNQSASKAEQIALAQFIRDGHLSRHIKKMRGLYGRKREVLYNSLKEAFSEKGQVLMGESGMEALLKLANGDEKLLSCSYIEENTINKGVKVLLEKSCQ